MKKIAFSTLSSINPTTAFQSYVDSIGSLLKTSARQNSIKHGISLHGHAIKMGISSHRYIQVKLLILYSNCNKSAESHQIFKRINGFDLVAWNCMILGHVKAGNIKEACHLFDEMPVRNEVTWTVMVSGCMKLGKVDDALWYFERNPFHNVVSWTATISGFVQNGFDDEALMLFCRMLESGVAPNEITFTSVVSSCVNAGNFRLGQNVLGLIVKTGFEKNLSVCNSLITLHLRMGDIGFARRVFDEMDKKDTVSWTAILDVYVEMGELKEARRIFDEMAHKNEISWSAMIARYNQSGNAEEALKLFAQMVCDGLKPNISCFSSVLGALASLEDLQLGMNVHGHVIKIGIDDDVFIGSTLIDMYCKCGKTEDGRQVFDLISERNLVSWNSMIAGYSYNCHFEEAKKLLEQMPMKNVVSWNALITGYVLNEFCEEVFDVFDDMLLSGAIPNESTFSSVLRACASLSSLETGKNLHGKIVKLGSQYNVYMGTALTDMYAKSGDIESSKKVFNRMPKKNEISWTAMIQGLADNGLAEESLLLFEDVLKTTVFPTELMFLGVLFACSHCGLVDKGLKYFESMQKDYGIKPSGKHYTCIVDLLSRAGYLLEAEEFIEAMPFQPEANAWAALLSACSIQGNEEIGERTGNKLWEMEKENSSCYVLLSNIYASAGRWSDASRVRRLMREKGLKKSGGCSWIEVKKEVHTFYVGGVFHPLSAEIYRILELLHSEMIL